MVFGIVTAEIILQNRLNCNISKNDFWHRMVNILISNYLAEFECRSTCARDRTITGGWIPKTKHKI